MNKCVLITGAAKRIGAAIATRLHDADFNITLHYHRSHDEATALANQLNNKRANSAIAIQADLLREEDQHALVNAHAHHWKQLDVLINNASRFYPTPIADATRAQWQDLMGSNLEAPFFLSQLCATHLQKTRGAIINIADIYAQKPLRHHSIYSISKAALVMLTKALATDLASDIRVNSIAPGNILWPEEDSLSDELKQKMVASTPLQRQGTPNDISEAVLFLINQPYMTGQIISVDGGKRLNG